MCIHYIGDKKMENQQIEDFAFFGVKKLPIGKILTVREVKNILVKEFSWAGLDGLSARDVISCMIRRDLIQGFHGKLGNDIYVDDGNGGKIFRIVRRN